MTELSPHLPRHLPPREILRLSNLSIALPHSADRAFAVEAASLTVSEGETLCLVGESGSGKSALAASIAGLLPNGLRLSQGEILLDGAPLHHLDEAGFRPYRGRQIGYIFQEPMTALNPVMRVGRQIGEALAAAGQADDPTAIERLIGQMHLPDPAAIVKRYPHQLSGGQRQRIAIAMAVAGRPKLLIADEPTTALDVTTQAGILALLKELRQNHGMAVLFITHDFGVVRDIADRVAVMQNGHILEEGPAKSVLQRPSTAYTRALLEAVPPLRARRQALVSAENRLRLTEVTKTHRTGFGLWRRSDTKALDGASLSLARGETLAIVGESGSGKSTLGQIITGLLERDSGEYLLNGQAIASAKQLFAPSLRPKVQMVFQDPRASLNPRHSIRRILTEPLRNQGLSAQEAESRMASLLERVGLSVKTADRLPHSFSGGQRQRIAIARALILQPDILVADEPVSALDVSVQAKVLDLLEELQRDMALAMIFITHDLRVAARMADRIAVMHRGTLIETAPTAALLTHPQSDYARHLINTIPGRNLPSSSEPAVRLSALSA